MDSTVPADLLKLKDRLEAWRANRKYTRQPIPDEFRQAAAEMARRYSPSLVRRILKLDPWRLQKTETKRSDRVHRKPQATFFTLPPDIALLEPRPVATSLAAGCRLLVERPDGARLALTLRSLDLASVTKLCADFLRD
jgi:hypothetical protein